MYWLFFYMDGRINAWILFGEVEGIIFYLRSKIYWLNTMSLEVKISLRSKMYWLVFTWISHVTGNVEYVMAVSNRSWRAMVGKSGAYHKSGSRRRKGEGKGVRTRGIGGKGASEKEGEGEERGSRESKLAPSPLPHAELHVMLIHVSRCPGLVLVEHPRRDVSDLQQLQIPSEHQAQHFNLVFA